MANYDELESKESYLGTRIKTGVPSQAYKDNYDRIFRNNQMDDIAETIEHQNLLHNLKEQCRG